MTPEVHAEHRHKAQSYLRCPLLNVLAMTPPMSTALGYRPTAQTSHDSHRELERGAHELKEDEETFQATAPGDNGTPMPFLVNPQTDVLPLFSRQMVK